MTASYPDKPTWHRFKDITGRRYNRLVVLQYAGKRGTSSLWECRCDCGVVCLATAAHLQTGNKKSCGCRRAEYVKKKKHGFAAHDKPRSPTYRSWLSARERCNNPESKDYPKYGGRGIKIDPRWDDFAAFLSDMGDRPTGTTLDRIDTDSHYAPGNCRWATAMEQAANRRRPLIAVCFDGEMKPLSELSRQLGVRDSVLRRRINLGWSIEEAVSRPVQGRRW